MFSKQINQELFAFYTYLSMATYFGRNSVALPGCQRFFLRMSDEERVHAQWLIDYQNMRGSVVEFCTITVPEPKEWQTPEDALKDALELEESVRQNLEAICESGAKFNDSSLCDFISDKFIQEQVRSQNEIRSLLATAARLGSTGIGIHLFDMMLRTDKLPFDKPSVFE